jgi:hypothetical protein
MSRTRKNRKHTRKTYRKRRVFKKTTISPTRADIMRGGSGVSFPASMNNNVVTPQSFLPFNSMSNDPNYSVIASRNTGPFLTGMKGGNRSRRIKGGSVINAINNSQPINEIPGAANIIAGFSGNQSIFSSTPMRISPLA